jgi:hypothetical protein
MAFATNNNLSLSVAAVLSRVLDPWHATTPDNKLYVLQSFIGLDLRTSYSVLIRNLGEDEAGKHATLPLRVSSGRVSETILPQRTAMLPFTRTALGNTGDGY